MAHLAHISLPHGLPTAVAARSREAKSIAVLYQLKAMHVGGRIKNFHANADCIANSFGFGRSKLLFYIKQLVGMGFIERPNKKDLRLTSTKKVALHYGCCPDDYTAAWHPKTYKLAVAGLDNIESILKALAIEENFTKQQHTLDKKLQNHYLLSRTSTPENLTALARKRHLKGYDPLLALREATSLWEQDLGTAAHNPAINPTVTLSRFGLAALFGRKSAMSGTRTARKLIRRQLLTEATVRHRVRACSYAEFVAGQRCGAYNRAHYYWNGYIWLRLANTLVVVSTHQAKVPTQK